MSNSTSYNLNQLRGAWGAGRAAAEKANADNRSIEGKFFHSFKDSKMCWQGRVLSAQPDGYFLVQFFSWLDGEPTNQELVKFSEMVTWHFYATQDEWLWAAAKDSYARDPHNTNTPEEQMEIHRQLEELSRPQSKRKRKTTSETPEGETGTEQSNNGE